MYLTKFLKKRPTHEDLKAKGILQVTMQDILSIYSPCLPQDSSVFGCKLEQQKLVSGQAVKVPELVWRCVEKIEAEPANLSTEGIYRVPGDAAKIQKLRIDLDQVKRYSCEVG